jgi:membrane protein required for colicin V production
LAPDWQGKSPNQGDTALLSIPSCPGSVLEAALMVDSPLQLYDFVMLAVLVACTAFGAWKGMAWQVAALASLVLSAGVAVHFGKPLAPYFSAEEPWNRFLAMLVLYLATSLAVWLVFRMVSGIIDRVRLKEFDRQLGALFGAAKGVLWCLVITFFAVTLSESARQAILHSRSGYYMAVLIERAAPVLPQEVRAVLGKYIEELDRKLDPQEGDQPHQTVQSDPPIRVVIRASAAR